MNQSFYLFLGGGGEGGVGWNPTDMLMYPDKNLQIIDVHREGI